MSSYRICRNLAVAGTLGLVPVLTWAVPAARVEFAIGSVSATSPAGQTRTLLKGDELDSGDTVNTHEGRVQLRFTDGAYVSLQPETLFRIDEYRYEGKADGNERGFFSLLKGGLRTITGLVGRTSKRNYRVNTTVATIGIRGTEYTLAYTSSVSGSVGEGEIDVCNGAGCLAIGSGQSFYVAAPEIRPQMTSKKTDLPPSQPGDVRGGKFASGSDPSELNGQMGTGTVVAGNQVTPAGRPAGLFPASVSAPPEPKIVPGEQTLSVVTAGAPGFFSETSVGVDANGAVTQIDLTPGRTVNGTSAGLLTFPNGLDEFGNSGIIAWGRGTGQALGYPQYTQYVTGLPTPLTDLNTLQLNRTVATYTVQGATRPTADVNGSTVFAIGTPLSATLSADFGNRQVNASLAFAMSGLTFQAKSQMAMISNLFTNPQTASSSCAVSNGASCNLAFMAGLFAGPKASQAGLVYDVSTHAITPPSSVCVGAPTACNSSATSIKGSFAFTRTP